MKSQNGWAASPDKSAIGIESPKVPGTDVDFPQGIREGDVTTVLMYVASEFHRTVEPLKDGWCWGYYYKQIEGSSTLSNHASGTAIDLNAPAHPMGKADTFSSTEVAAIRKILDFCDVVRWGGDYTGRKDDMHFEIVGDAAAVALVAAKIRALDGKPTPSPSLPSYRLGSRLLRKGMKGTDVKEVQAQLIKRGRKIAADGDFGAKTDAATRDFQKARWLDPDGIIGPDTLGALRTNLGVRVLKRGINGSDVKELQRLLNLHGARLVLDGDFGSKTDAAVRVFQRSRKLAVDGQAGPKTVAALRR